MGYVSQVGLIGTWLVYLIIILFTKNNVNRHVAVDTCYLGFSGYYVGCSIYQIGYSGY